MTAESNEAQTVDVSDDLIIGVKKIARFLGQPERKTYHLIERGLLPGTFKLGERQHAALKSVLIANLHARAKGAARDGGRLTYAPDAASEAERLLSGGSK